MFKILVLAIPNSKRGNGVVPSFGPATELNRVASKNESPFHETIFNLEITD